MRPEAQKFPLEIGSGYSDLTVNVNWYEATTNLVWTRDELKNPQPKYVLLEVYPEMDHLKFQ